MAWSHDDNVYFPDDAEDFCSCIQCGAIIDGPAAFCSFECEAEFKGIDPTDIDEWGKPENFQWSFSSDDLPF